MTDTHGVAIICEREGGHTVAYVDAQQSRHVPAGYFIEWWPQDGTAYMGNEAEGYIHSYEGWGPRYYQSNPLGALAWCQHDARQKARRAA